MLCWVRRLTLAPPAPRPAAPERRHEPDGAGTKTPRSGPFPTFHRWEGSVDIASKVTLCQIKSPRSDPQLIQRLVRAHSPTPPLRTAPPRYSPCPHGLHLMASQAPGTWVACQVSSSGGVVRSTPLLN